MFPPALESAIPAPPPRFKLCEVVCQLFREYACYFQSFSNQAPKVLLNIVEDPSIKRSVFMGGFLNRKETATAFWSLLPSAPSVTCGKTWALPRAYLNSGLIPRSKRCACYLVGT